MNRKRVTGDEKVGSVVLKKASKKLGVTEQEIMDSICGYSSKNKGTKGWSEGGKDTDYGHATETLAEAFAEYRTSDSPRKECVTICEIFDEYIRSVK